MLDSDEIAVCFEGRSITFRQLQNEVYHVISQLGFCKQQSVIGLVSDNKWHTFLLVHAFSQLNKTLLHLGSALSTQRMQYLLDESSCELLITERKELELSSNISTVNLETVFSSSSSRIYSQKFHSPSFQAIVATSGSSGKPKGVILSAQAITASANSVNKKLGLHAGDCWLNCLPLYHIAGLSIIYRCTIAFASMLLCQRFEAEKVWRELHDFPVTHISLVPPMLSLLLEVSEGTRPPERLRVVLVGGGFLSPQLASRAHDAGWPLAISYGMTETASMCVCDTSKNAGLVEGRVGFPLEGFDISLSAKKNNIIVAGPTLMSGYVNQDQVLAKGLGDTGFSTGDSGKWGEDGSLYITGRVDDVLVSAGKTIHPREVEERLEHYPGADLVAVTAVADPVWGDCLVAVVDSDSCDLSDLKSWARKQLPSSICPRLFVKVDAFPMTVTAKLDRMALKELILQHNTD